MLAASIKPRSLSDWLLYLETLHPKTIEMGLERVDQVRLKLGLTPSFPIIIVGGTNGKGSVCTMLEAILSCAGYRVGCYTSPHILRCNERIRIQQEEITDEALCQAFEIVNSARTACGISLTFFEFFTLAAMHLFIQARVDVAILEVGLGGRLDAVNVFDAECAILASINLDHIDYLGSTKEMIGFEKAGVFRQDKPAICAQFDPPVTIRQQAEKIGANFIQIGKQFGFSSKADQWDFWGPKGGRYALPYPALLGVKQLQNASACLAALDMLDKKLPVSMNAIRQGLLEAVLPGRFQVLPSQPPVILDVAHNPDAARTLATNLATMPFSGCTYAVFSMLKDKDITGVIQELKRQVDVWLISTIHVARGACTDDLIEKLHIAGISQENGVIHAFPDSVAAFVFACERASKNDRICVLGSFHTVGAVLQYQNMARGG
jgi:dihydrofolate synthase / folylpolyglutamate synthase